MSIGPWNVAFQQKALKVPDGDAPPAEGSGARATEALFQTLATRNIPAGTELLADYGPNFKITD